LIKLYKYEVLSIGRSGIMMMQALLFVASGIFIGLSIGLLLFKLATKEQLKKTKLKAMATMYHELLLKRRNDGYRYSEDVETAVKAVNIYNLVE